MITPSRICYAAFIAWLLGCAWPVTIDASSTDAALIALILIGALLALLMFKRVVLLCLFVAAAFLLAGSHGARFMDRQARAVASPPPGEIRLTVLDKPLKQDDKARYKARLPDDNVVLLTLPRASPVTPGTDVITSAPIRPIQTKNEQYAMSLVRDRVIGEIAYPTHLTTEPAKLNAWDHAVIGARTLFEEESRRLFAQPQSSLFIGLVVGITADIPANVLESYKITGLSHLIAVSGFNVTIVMTLLSQFTQRFGRWLNALFMLFSIIFFVVFTGGSSSVTRAGIMAALALAAALFQRKCTILRAMIITAVAMTVANPLTLRYDIGFQLSFAAVVGLFAFATPLQQILQRARLPPLITETLAATTAAQIITVPITGYYFASVNPYGLLANLLVGPVIPFITAFGIPLVFISRYFSWLSWISLPFDLAMRYSIETSHLLAKFPYAASPIPNLPAGVWIIYGLALYRLYRVLNRPQEEPLREAVSARVV